MTAPPSHRLLRALAAARRVRARTEVGGDPAARTQGEVEFSRTGDALVLRESGRRRAGREAFHVHDVTRWSPEGASAVWVEHLRKGPGSPVPLALLCREGPGAWASASPHVCGRDRYRLRVEAGDPVVASWTRTGPGETVRVEKRYRRAAEASGPGSQGASPTSSGPLPDPP